jgi:hypothetical protein
VCVIPEPSPEWNRITHSQSTRLTVACDHDTLTSHVMANGIIPNTTTGRANDLTCRHNTINPHVFQVEAGDEPLNPGEKKT